MMIVRQALAPEFEHFLRPCPFGKRPAGCDMDPGLRPERVISGIERQLNYSFFAPR